jgi:hypothetical protein
MTFPSPKWPNPQVVRGRIVSVSRGGLNDRRSWRRLGICCVLSINLTGSHCGLKRTVSSSLMSKNGQRIQHSTTFFWVLILIHFLVVPSTYVALLRSNMDSTRVSDGRSVRRSSVCLSCLVIFCRSFHAIITPRSKGLEWRRATRGPGVLRSTFSSMLAFLGSVILPMDPHLPGQYLVAI